MAWSSTATSSGKINEAEKELMAASEALGNADSGFSSDASSGSTRGAPRARKSRQSCCPQAADLRLHAEHAIVLLAQARAGKPRLEGAGCARPPWTWARAAST